MSSQSVVCARRPFTSRSTMSPATFPGFRSENCLKIRFLRVDDSVRGEKELSAVESPTGILYVRTPLRERLDQPALSIGGSPGGEQPGQIRACGQLHLRNGRDRLDQFLVVLLLQLIDLFASLLLLTLIPTPCRVLWTEMFDLLVLGMHLPA